MDYTSRHDDAEKATLTSAQPYDENEIRLGALRTIIAQRDKVILAQESHIVALTMEVERLRETISALESEDLERTYHHNCFAPRADGRYEQ